MLSIPIPSTLACDQDQGNPPWSPSPREDGSFQPRQQQELCCPSNLSLYLAEISAIPLLSPEQEHALALRVQHGDGEARRSLLEANLRLVVHVAKPYATAGTADLPLLDHIQNGFFGLLKAVERFDPARHLHFSTYAIWWIRQAITRALHNTARLIRLPIYLQRHIHTMDQQADAWFLAHGTEPTIGIPPKLGSRRREIWYNRNRRVLWANLNRPTAKISSSKQFSYLKPVERVRYK